MKHNLFSHAPSVLYVECCRVFVLTRLEVNVPSFAAVNGCQVVHSVDDSLESSH